MKNESSYNNISIGNYISIFYRIGMTYLSREYTEYEIGYGQYQFLITLYYEDNLSQDELTKRVCVDKATTTRSINKLKELGYITVTVDTEDKRVRRVKLTEKALSIKEEILQIAKGWEDKLVNSLSEDDKILMESLFKKIGSANGWISLENK